MPYTKNSWNTGDIITAAKLNHMEDGIAASDLSAAVKTALLQIAAKVAYIDDQGQEYYDALEEALYPDKTLTGIGAAYDQSGSVYPTTSLDSLKSDLTVTAYYDDGSTATVTTYTLSGTLSVGTSTVTVTYSGFTDTFDVTVSAAPTVSSISAVYTQSGTVYDTDSLDSLKSDLVVTATYSDSSTATVPSADYTLSGTLTVGTSTITVSYEGKTTTFNVTVTQALFWKAISVADDLREGLVPSSSYSATYDGYYSSNSSRCGWSELDEIVLVTGYKYTFTWDESQTPSGKSFGIYSRSAECLTAYANHQSIGSYSGTDSGWKQSYEFTPAVDTVFSVQCNSTQASLISAGLTAIWINREAVA